MFKLLLLFLSFNVEGYTISTNTNRVQALTCNEDKFFRFIELSKRYTMPQIKYYWPSEDTYTDYFDIRLAETTAVALEELNQELIRLMQKYTNNEFLLKWEPVQHSLTERESVRHCNYTESSPFTHICFVESISSYMPNWGPKVVTDGFVYFGELTILGNLKHTITTGINFKANNTRNTTAKNVYINKEHARQSYELQNSIKWEEQLKALIKHEILHTMGFCHNTDTENVMTLNAALHIPNYVYDVYNIPEPDSVKSGHYFSSVNLERNREGFIEWDTIHNDLRFAIRQANPGLYRINEEQFNAWVKLIEQKMLVK